MKLALYIFSLLPLILLSACCGEIYAGQQKVDVTPLYELEVDTQGVERLSDLVDLSKFPPVSPDREPRDFAYWGREDMGGEVQFYLALDIDTAASDFIYDCESYVAYPSLIQYGGEKDNQYCLPYVTQARDGPEGLCLPQTGKYHSYIVFQKGKLEIIIDIRTYNNPYINPYYDNKLMDALIEEVANSFW